MKHFLLLIFLFPLLVYSQKTIVINVGGGVEQSELSDSISLLRTYINDEIKPYRTYIATITQDGTSAPIATVLENSLGATVVWSRSTIGYYVGTATGAFTGNLWANSGVYLGVGEATLFNITKLSNNQIALRTFTFDLFPSEGDAISDNPIRLEVRVY